jgi:hypothetical protein
MEKSARLFSNHVAMMFNTGHSGDTKQDPLPAVDNKSINGVEKFEAKAVFPENETEDFIKSFSIYFNQ